MTASKTGILNVLFCILALSAAPARAWRWGSPRQLTATVENSALPSSGSGFASINSHLHVLYSDWDHGVPALHYLRSYDHGVTWLSPVVVEEKSESNTFSIAADSSGNVHLVNRRSSDHGLYYRRSQDTGAVWDTAVLLSATCDNMLLLTNRRSNAYIFNVVPGTPPSLFMYKSTDGGASWAQGVRVLRTNAFNNLCGCVTGEGDIDIFYCWGGPGARVFTVRSTDDGATWSGETSIPSIPTESSAKGIWRLGDLIFLVTTTWEDTVNFRRSTDGGDTWQAGQRLPVLLNCVVWTRDGDAHAVGVRGDTEIVWLTSANHGATWSAPVVISGRHLGYRASPYIGADDEFRLHAVWGSRETGNWEIFTTFADTTGVEEPETSPALPGRGILSPNPARGWVRLAGAPGAELFDREGCKVSKLAPGVNDIRSLAPGVYFFRGRGVAHGSAMRKVVILR